MKIVVHYTTQLRRALDRDQDEVSLDKGATVSQLLDRLAQSHPQAFAQFVIDPQGQLRPNMIVSVDDQQVVEPHAYVLNDGATVTLLSAISGG